jgi:hypothetical protein
MDLACPNNTEPEARVRVSLDFLRDTRFFRMRKRNLRRLAPYLRAALLFNTPLRLISYWGVGTRANCGRHEEEALAFLCEWLAELTSILGLSYELEFLITDTHARINDVPEATLDSYAVSAEELLSRNGFRAHITSHWIRNRIQNEGETLASNFPVSEAEWLQLPDGWRDELKRCASLRQNGKRVSDEQALRYYRENLIESAIVGRELPGYALISYQNPELDFLLPPLPAIYAYVGPNQLAKRPWFREEI